ncbi:MAG TPA: YncE family protein [Verrucomicrobiae bacterium]
MKRFLIPLMFSAIATQLCHSAEPYHLLKEIPVGGDGGWDYLTVDSASQRLYVSHGTQVVVIDTSKDTVIGEITNTPGVHGIALAPDLKRGLVTCGRENKGALVDLTTLTITSKVETGANPDGMLYEPSQKEFYTFNGRGNSATVIAAQTGTVTATIPLGGKPEFPQTDTSLGRVFDNLEDKSEVVAIDIKQHAVVNRWPVAPGEEPSGSAYDAKTHHLFLGCGNQMMVMMDAASGKVLDHIAIGDGVDANAFDPGLQYAFASCGDGTTTIAKEEGDKLTLVQTLKTEKGARTMTLDPATHKIYLASAKFDAPAEGQRHGKLVAGSFKVLVYGLAK